MLTNFEYILPFLLHAWIIYWRISRQKLWNLSHRLEVSQDYFEKCSIFIEFSTVICSKTTQSELIRWQPSKCYSLKMNENFGVCLFFSVSLSFGSITLNLLPNILIKIIEKRLIASTIILVYKWLVLIMIKSSSLCVYVFCVDWMLNFNRKCVKIHFIIIH